MAVWHQCASSCALLLLLLGSTVRPAGAAQAPPCDVQVDWDAPSDGAVVVAGALLRVRGRALVPTGEAAIRNVTVGLDDAFALPADYEGPATGRFSLDWDTTRVPRGAHALRLVVESGCGTVEVGPRRVQVTDRPEPGSAPD